MCRNQDGLVLQTGATSLEPQSINTVTLLISPAPARSPSWLTLIMLTNKSHYITTVTCVALHQVLACEADVGNFNRRRERIHLTHLTSAQTNGITQAR